MAFLGCYTTQQVILHGVINHMSGALAFAGMVPCSLPADIHVYNITSL